MYDLQQGRVYLQWSDTSYKQKWCRYCAELALIIFGYLTLTDLGKQLESLGERDHWLLQRWAYISLKCEKVVLITAEMIIRRCRLLKAFNNYLQNSTPQSFISKPLIDFRGVSDPFANGGEIGTGVFPGSDAERYVVRRPHTPSNPAANFMATDALPAGLTATSLLEHGAYTTNSEEQTYLASLLDNVARTIEVDAVLKPCDTPVSESDRKSIGRRGRGSGLPAGRPLQLLWAHIGMK
jgi:hypothetical protein